MKDRETLITLYEIYKNLFTDKQQNYFEMYYFEDLSLSEIAQNNNVSKSIIGKTISNVETKLKEYESLLNINKLYKSINKIKEKTTDSKTKEELNKLLNE